MDTLNLVLRGMVMGAAILMPTLLLVQRHRDQVTWATAGLGIAIVSEILLTMPGIIDGSPVLHYVLLVARSLMALSFAWFVFCIFTDAPISLREPELDTSIVLGCGALAFVLGFLPHEDNWLWIVCQSLVVLTFMGSVFVVLRTAKHDLVDRRRRMRAIFVTTLGAVGTLLILLDYIPALDPYPEEVGIFKSITIFVLLAVSASLLFQPLEEITPERQGPSGKGPKSDVSDWVISKIERVMQDGIWAEEGLTISDLADKVGAPEYLVRKTINQRMGFRNFPTFVNSYRIRAAQDMLADPNQSRTSVLEIAYQVGFASLGPFNKAFKDFSEATPTEFRKQAFAEQTQNISISEKVH